MSLTAGSTGIHYAVYGAHDAEEMTGLLADAFSRRDPLALAAGITAAEFTSFVGTLLPRAAEERLSIVARLKETGEMVGALLTNDPAFDAGLATAALGRKFEMVTSILGKLAATYQAGREPAPGETLHLYLLGVSDRAAGMGVGQRLIKEAVAHGTVRGYEVAIAEATNTTSQHIFRKLGFVERVKISYRDHVFDNRHVFAEIAEHGGPMLMERKLSPHHATKV
jgi:ribosomal protein S18 acetylase RimI-like enzyme